MGVDNLNVLIVLAQKGLEVNKGLFDPLCQISDGFRLRRTDSSEDTFGCEQDLASEIITAHAFRVGHTVDLSENCDQFRSLLCVLGCVDYDTTPRFLFLLDCCQVFVRLNGLRYVTPGVSFNQHKFKDIDLFIGHPSLVKVVQMLSHVLNYLLHRDVHSVLYNSLIQVPDNVLNDTELLEELAAGVKNFMGEDILFAIDPQVRESFLRGVEDLGQVAQTAFFVQHFVGLRELFTVVTCCAIRFKNFA